MLLPPSPCAQPHSGAGGLVHSSPTAQVWLAALAQTPQACWGPCEGLLRTPLVIRQIAAMLLRHLTLFVAGYVLCFIVYGFVEGCEGVEKAQGLSLPVFLLLAAEPTHGCTLLFCLHATVGAACF